MEKLTLTNFLTRHPNIILDTMVFIYQFEAHKRFSPLTHTIFTSLESKKNQGFVSTVSLLEILVKPKQLNNFPLALRYYEAIAHSPFLTAVSVTPEIADLASGLRVKYNLATPDATVIASGLHMNASGFITADKRLARVEELDVLVLK